MELIEHDCRPNVGTLSDRYLIPWIEDFRHILPDVSYFLSNCKYTDYKQIIMNMLYEFQALGCSLSVKLHLLHSHVDFSLENLRSFSKEQGERFHQDIKDMRSKYKGR
ncbi:hypothetical protein LAZ67_4002289 [Cordylochernes scorpioides]|uniref:Uncharacterized protein n=1 Tax=Cordylochernes scorpioides TaxID=51811 RepID=A0ABY6KDP2_9ARAC|nr:hypothetical protein LAZ67_4002289 [Cordylochernes scorpioides]